MELKTEEGRRCVGVAEGCTGHAHWSRNKTFKCLLTLGGGRAVELFVIHQSGLEAKAGLGMGDLGGLPASEAVSQCSVPFAEAQRDPACFPFLASAVAEWLKVQAIKQ